MVGVSVIIPVYNRENFIGEAIQSVLDQDFDGDIEIIVSDDGSTDKSIEIAESFGPLVRVLHKPIDCLSQGVSGARNRGILVATQPYIGFLDSDDFYLPGHLISLVSVLELRHDIGFAFSRMQEVKEVDGLRQYSPWTRPIITDRDVRYLGLTRSRLLSMNVLILRSDVFDKIGKFNETYSNGEDGDLWIRLGEHFDGFFLDQAGAVCRREHGAAQLSNNQPDIIRECALRVFSAALERVATQPIKDKYRFFLLKLKVYGLKYSGINTPLYIFHLVSMLFWHPFLSIVYLIEYLHLNRKGTKVVT